MSDLEFARLRALPEPVFKISPWPNLQQREKTASLSRSSETGGRQGESSALLTRFHAFSLIYFRWSSLVVGDDEKPGENGGSTTATSVETKLGSTTPQDPLPLKRQRHTLAWALALSNLRSNSSIARSLQVPLYPSKHVWGSAKTIAQPQRLLNPSAPALHRSPSRLWLQLPHLKRRSGGSKRSSIGDDWERTTNTRCSGRIPGCARASWRLLRRFEARR